jgi:CheY-like chemotaxis protein
MFSILIVEDDFIVAKVIEKSLIDLGYSIAGLAATAEDAIAIARRERPDLVLMDIRLQGKMDGIEASENIHSTLDIPVVFLTAFSDQKTFERALVTAPYGYIIKPFSINTLSTTIRVALNKKNADNRMHEHQFWLDSTMDSLPEGIITVNAAGNVILLNKAAAMMTGWTQQNGYEQPLDTVLTFLDPITEHSFHFFISPVIREGIIGTIPADSFILSKDKNRLLIEDSFAYPIRNKSGEITGAAIIIYTKAVSLTAKRPAHQSNRSHAPVHEISIAFENQQGSMQEPKGPYDAVGWYDRGNYLLFLRRYQDALNAYENAIAMNSLNHQSWFGKGTALAKLERFDEALLAYEKALSIYPRNARILIAQGDLLKKIGNDAEAERCYELARMYSA